MIELGFFILGAIFSFLALTILFGVSYSAAVALGRGVGMCEGVLMASKIFYRTRHSDKVKGELKKSK